MLLDPHDSHDATGSAAEPGAGSLSGNASVSAVGGKIPVPPSLGGVGPVSAAPLPEVQDGVGEDEGGLAPSWRLSASFVTSLLVHVLLLSLLALIVIQGRDGSNLLSLVSGEESLPSPNDLIQTDIRVSNQALESFAQTDFNMETEIPNPDESVIGQPSAAVESESAPLATVADLNTLSNLPVGGGLAGRTEDRRQQLRDSEGGTESSEQAVDLGLRWLAAHQRVNGAWWFDFHDSECQGRCRHPGSNGSTTAATGLALLCFLGRGETPEQGEYKEVVRRGLYYLQSRMVFTRSGGDLQEGTMYGHAIATMAMCEAYGMTQDAALAPVAQKALDFIVASQHQRGGWRYTPGQPGDTTVTGWQIMALQSGKLAGLEVPSHTLSAAAMYLDTAQTHLGSRYKYIPEAEDETPVPTAVGLLCRMYLGWARTITPLRNGAAYLAELGPSPTDLYFDYYATQVLHHYGDPHWDEWNIEMRDYLIGTQSRSGHEAGSWHFNDPHGDVGGRLYSTAMAIMILEVYYRYLPLYGERAVDFPL